VCLETFMKPYEIMTIYKLDLGDQGAKDLSTKVQETITSLEGKIVKAQFWGKRKFAYEIKGQTEGYYDVINIELDSAKISKLKAKLNIVTGLTRYLITAQS
jgi:small subunit ribosomal protein S6